MEEKFIPPTLLECFRLIEQEVSPKSVEQCKNFRDAHFPPLDHNFGWGIYMRNRFIHPKHSPIRRKFKAINPVFEPDNMSSEMKKLFWMYLNDQKLDAPSIAQEWRSHYLIFPEQTDASVHKKIADLLGE